MFLLCDRESKNITFFSVIFMLLIRLLISYLISTDTIIRYTNIIYHNKSLIRFQHCSIIIIREIFILVFNSPNNNRLYKQIIYTNNLPNILFQSRWHSDTWYIFHGRVICLVIRNMEQLYDHQYFVHKIIVLNEI